MTETESHDHDDATSMSESSGERTERLTPDKCHETVDPATRDAVLDEYAHRCQVCGRRSPEEGGLATLHVHHIERDPDGMDEHDMENLSLLCRPCHEWLHQQVDPTDAPVQITEADRTVLLPQDIGILRVLADDGPARTGDVAAKLTVDLTVSAVRERLWVLMGLDNRIDERARQIVDKDVETGEWGLVNQIETSARGHIPEDDQLLLQRMEDEQVRRALERGCDREAVMDVLDVSERSTFYKAKRAYAFDLPLDAFSRGGRPPADSKEQQSDSEPSSETTDTQQRLDTVTETDSDDAVVLGDADAAMLLSGFAQNGVPGESGDELRRELDAAIETLEALRSEVE